MSADEYVEDDAFFKALQSDVDDAISLKLLTDVYDTNALWSEFTEEEIAQVVEVFSILNMAPGDKLIAKGEYATFCGIVLQGTFNAIVSPTFTVPLRAGEMVGEMALFEGGARNADIVTGTDAEGCILGVITFADLDNLAMNPRYAQLARKLTSMFATASIKKLRGMLNASAAAPKAAAATPAEDGTAAAPLTVAVATNEDGTVSTPVPVEAPTAPVVNPLSPTVAAAAAAAGVSSVVVPPPLPGGAIAGVAGVGSIIPSTSDAAKKERARKAAERAAKPVVAETLYKNKMSKAAAGGSGANAALAPRNISEAQTALEEQQLKLRRTEHAKRNQQVMLERATRNARVAEENLRTQEETIARLTHELKTTSDQLKDLTREHAIHMRTLNETTEALEVERRTRAEFESSSANAHAELAERTSEESTRLREALERTTLERDEARTSLEGEKATLASLLSAHEAESSRHATTSGELAERSEKASKELIASRVRCEQLEVELRASVRHADDQRATMSTMSLRLLDLDEKLAAAMTWKLKALEFQSGLDAEKKRHVRLSDDWNKTSKELETEVRQYRLLLKTFSVTMYAKEFRLRRALAALHKRVSEMLLTTLEEHYNTATGKERGAKGAASAGSGSGSLALAAAAGSPSAVSTTFRSVRKRKKAYLETLLRSGPGGAKLRDVVASLDDEVSKLKGPFEELRERVSHWRATSESFFQRNIDLASKLMTLDKSLVETAAAKDHASAAAKQTSRDLEKLAAKHADLSARVQHGGGGGGGNSVAPGPSGSHSARGASTSGSNNGNGGADDASRAQRANEVELLEARATVLRVHVQQLESHYLQLQSAIHHLGVGAGAGPVGAGGSAAAAPFQESKQGGGGPELGDRFDPALVSPVPFPPPSAGQMVAPYGYFGAPQSPMLGSPRGAIVLAPRGGAPILYHHAPPSTAPGSSSSRYYAAAAPPSHGPLSPPRPDVISLRALREQNVAAAAAAQAGKLPAVAGAYPSPYGGGPSPPGTHRTTLNFSPATARPNQTGAKG